LDRLNKLEELLKNRSNPSLKATMSIAERFLFIGLALLLLEAEATSRLGSSHGVADDSDYQGQSGGGGSDGGGGGGGGDQSVFNVNSYGAQADGETNNQEVMGSDTILIEINCVWLPYIYMRLVIVC
jgi:hypothetical protein